MRGVAHIPACPYSDKPLLFCLAFQHSENLCRRGITQALQYLSGGAAPFGRDAARRLAEQCVGRARAPAGGAQQAIGPSNRFSISGGPFHQRATAGYVVNKTCKAAA